MPASHSIRYVFGFSLSVAHFMPAYNNDREREKARSLWELIIVYRIRECARDSSFRACLFIKGSNFECVTIARNRGALVPEVRGGLCVVGYTAFIHVPWISLVEYI